MFYCVNVSRFKNRNDIETRFFFYFSLFKIVAGRYNQVVLLATVHGHFRFAKHIGAAGLHLYENNDSFFFGNNVYLITVKPPVKFKHLVTLLIQKMPGSFFRLLPQFATLMFHFSELKLVSYTLYGFNVFFSQLFSQLAYVHVNGAVAHNHLISPNLIENKLAGKDFAGLAA